MKKIFIFLPDGVGLRNFVFNDFYKNGLSKSFDITYWNNTRFHIDKNTLKVPKGKSNWLTDIFKRTRKEIELKQFNKKFNDKTYASYSFPKKYNTLKNIIKNCIVELCTIMFNSDKGLKVVRRLMVNLERKSTYYDNVKKQLANEKPNFIFSTNQRPIRAIAPILAAKDLNIPTATFIFSWDNLPKGTLVIETDYYFVWSHYMKEELLKYYPFIKKSQIKITGTPQFETHYYETLKVEREVFFNNYNLDLNKKYICFSGDDVTTSPNDQFYLEDVANAIKNLNSKGFNLGLIYRKCPVDFTNRHKEVYNKFNDIIVLIDPLWDNIGNGWDHVMPNKEDTMLLVNTVRYTEMVINVGSSMVFDYVAHNKPCAFLNYNTIKTVKLDWNIEKIYKYIHFRSMPSKEAVLWINNINEIEDIIIKGLNKNKLDDTKEWYKIICGENPSNSSALIWKTIQEILD